MAWRLTFGFWQKFKQKRRKNVEHKSSLDARYERLQERIDIMADLLPQTVNESFNGTRET